MALGCPRQRPARPPLWEGFFQTIKREQFTPKTPAAELGPSGSDYTSRGHALAVPILPILACRLGVNANAWSVVGAADEFDAGRL